MTPEEKTNYTRIGLALAGIAANDTTCEIIWRTVDGINEKKGQFSLRDAVDIEVKVTGKYTPKRVTTYPKKNT